MSRDPIQAAIGELSDERARLEWRYDTACAMEAKEGARKALREMQAYLASSVAYLDARIHELTEEAKASGAKAPEKAGAKAADFIGTKADGPVGWWDEWASKAYAKACVCRPGSSIVKLACEGGHGSELRAAGWQWSKKALRAGGETFVGYWWAYKDERKASGRGERHKAKKAAKA